MSPWVLDLTSDSGIRKIPRVTNAQSGDFIVTFGVQFGQIIANYTTIIIVDKTNNLEGSGT